MQSYIVALVCSRLVVRLRLAHVTKSPNPYNAGTLSPRRPHLCQCGVSGHKNPCGRRFGSQTALCAPGSPPGGPTGGGGEGEGRRVRHLPHGPGEEGNMLLSPQTVYKTDRFAPQAVRDQHIPSPAPIVLGHEGKQLVYAILLHVYHNFYL